VTSVLVVDGASVVHPGRNDSSVPKHIVIAAVAARTKIKRAKTFENYSFVVMKKSDSIGP
jgi:hypothetical protein